MKKLVVSPVILFLLVLSATVLDPESCPAQTKQQGSDILDYKPGKGAIYIRSNLLFPMVNWFSYTNTGYDRLSRVGFGFFNLGLDYYYKDGRFINLTAGESYDLKAPASVTYGFGGKDSEKIQVLHVSFSNNYSIGKFTLGYGLSYGYDRWKFKYWENNTDQQYDNYKISYLCSNSLGFVFPLYFCPSPDIGLCIGLVYRPMLLQFSDKAGFRYQHTLSLDLGLRIRVKK